MESGKYFKSKNQAQDPFSSAGFSVKEILLLTGISLGYLLLSWALIGLRPEQLILIILYNGLYFATPLTRKMILGFSVFAVYWIIFDYMKAFPNYEFATVHIQNLYDTEKAIFGISVDGALITANEYWLKHTSPWLDIMSGIFYLCWIPVPLLFGVFLFFRNRELFLKFSLTFMMANLVGFVIYYTYPAAPPWYYHDFGREFIPNTPGGIAGLGRFDSYFNVHVFQSIYSKSSNVFAAVPSLHSAYPLVVLYYGIKAKLGPATILLAIVTGGIWFAAIYTSHHYILDVLVGIACAATGIIIFNLLVKRNPWKRWFDSYLTVIK